MADFDFSTYILNVPEDSIESFSTYRSDNVLHICVRLRPDFPVCPCCGGASKIKGYSSYSYNHLDIAGIPSVIDWKRRRYACKDCGKSFSEVSPFGLRIFTSPTLFSETSPLLCTMFVSLTRTLPHAIMSRIPLSSYILTASSALLV